MLAIHGYTQQQYEVLLTILYLTHTTYYYDTTAAVFAVCTYIARPPPLLLVIHGYTQQLYEVLLTLYLARLLYYVLLSAVCTYDIPPSVCIAFLLSRRRSPAAGLVRYTQQYTAVRFLVH